MYQDANNGQVLGKTAQMPTTVKLREDSAFDLPLATFLPTFTWQTMRQEASLRVSSYRGDLLRTPSSSPQIHPGISQCPIPSAIKLIMKVFAYKFFRG